MTATTSRSDDVRAKRNRRNQKQQTSRKKAKHSSRINRSMPPTVARNKSMARPAQSQAKVNVARKRYNLALTQTGAELRLPSLPQIQIGWRFISAFLAVSMLWLIFTVWNSPNFRIKQTEIIGLDRLNSAEVDQFLALRNQSIFSLDPSVIAERLENNFKSLSNITVSLGLPNQVIIELEERDPAILWTQSGISVWIDNQGMAFEANEENTELIRVEALQAPTSNIKTVDGKEQLLSEEMVAAIISIANQAPENTVLVFDPEHGLGWVDPRGWKVYFGPEPTDMELRLSMYQNTVDYITRKGILPAMISLEYIHQPFFRLQP